jgi:16S rRNA (uracil1498-N3)-methyltransferase
VRVGQPVSAEDAAAGRLTLTAQASHYVLTVHRLRPGDAFEIFDGQGKNYPATLETLDAKAASARLGAPRQDTLSVGPPVVLVQALLKADKLEWVLQKCTELGAHAFELCGAHRSVVKLEPGQQTKKLERWQKIPEEAARQCGRSDVPSVRVFASLEEAVKSAQGSGGGAQILLLDEEASGATLSRAWREAEPTERRVLVVGPEGGWERAEVQRLEALGARRVTLGQRILRAETAAIASVALLQHLGGSFG